MFAGSTALALVAATGIYLVVRGKAQKAKQLKAELEKQFAKFENGKALTNSGKNFTGQLTKNLKDGSKVVIDYENGILKSTQKFDGERKIYEKFYHYNEQGKLAQITQKTGLYSESEFPKVIWNKYVNNMGFVRTRIKRGSVYINKATNEMLITKVSKDGKSFDRYYKDGKLKYINDDNYIELYKDDGKTLECTISSTGDLLCDSKGNKFRCTESYDGIRRADDSSSMYEYFLQIITDSPYTAQKRPPKRYSMAMGAGNGVAIKHRAELEDTIYGLKNSYEYRNKEQTKWAKFSFSKNICKNSNPKRHQPEPVFVNIVKGKECQCFTLYEEKGKVFIRNFGDNKHHAVFNTKTNTFETMKMDADDAKEVLEFAQKASKQFMKDRKDFLNSSKLRCKVNLLRKHVADIEQS